MSEQKVNPQFEGTVRLQSALMGLTLAFKRKYGDEALEVAKAFNKQLGTKTGKYFKEKAGVRGSDLNDIESVLRAWQDPVVLGPKPKSKIEGKKLTMTRESSTLCPALQVAKQMNIPLEIVCNTVAFPIFRGVAESVNPDAKHTNVQISQEKCVDIIEIP